MTQTNESPEYPGRFTVLVGHACLGADILQRGCATYNLALLIT
jgi:hypothetical protein